MLRELQVTMNKPANTMLKCGEEKVMTGMAVVKNITAGEFEFKATADDLFFVDQERIPKGINAARTDMSDYSDDFVIVAEGEYAKLIAYYVGERFATDQFVKAGLAVGDRLAANATGKLVKATSASKYIYQGTMDDNGHELAIVEVGDAATNA